MKQDTGVFMSKLGKKVKSKPQGGKGGNLGRNGQVYQNNLMSVDITSQRGNRIM